ncbi:C45 family autoproteolytic acyltransferase/hydolase [Paenibacillus sp.]|uniref:C45 family autoproteolytic acyltransferase/hydolase n=1 Tax=Paenibacillus sp. TaxID=58172 RepID=UPI003565024E
MVSPDQESSGARSSRTFPYYRFRGSHRQIGQQYGEACAGLIERHLELAQERLKTWVEVPTQEALMEAVMHYRTYVQRYAPYFDEEIQGIAEGANITLAEAYLLQLRAEIYRNFQSNNECTTFAVSSQATSNGIPLIGQNADLPHFYSEIGVVVEFVPDDQPACLMFAPAGQVSYIGINNLGLGVFANFLTCDGWRFGFPRYMLSRYALTCSSTVEEAIQAVRSLHRASSRNLIMMDRFGHAADLETIPTTDALLLPDDGILVHSNHFIGSDLQKEERLSGHQLVNSRIRQSRMKELLVGRKGELNADVMQDILRDRQTYPHTLSAMPEDDGTDNMTVASVIAEPDEGRLWIAVGPPHQYNYKMYAFSN